MNIKIYDNIKNLNLNFSKLSLQNATCLAYKLFCKNNHYHTYYNNGIKIIVTKDSIQKSMENIYKIDNQKQLKKEHILIYNNLGEIICKANDISNKDKLLYIKPNIEINDKKYILKFSVYKDEFNNLNCLINKLYQE